MKKNKLMRLASVLLVLCLLTTSVISGTFAKYVTTDSAQDTARVAKFGVVATISGSLYGEHYDSGTTNPSSYTTENIATVSHDADVTGNIVAPGTKNDVGITFSIVGEPEVSTKVTFTTDEDNYTNGSAKDYAISDITLKSGEYGVMVPYTGVKTTQNITNYYKEDNGTYTQATTNDVSLTVYELKDVATLTANYQPVKYTYKLGDGAEQSNKTAEEAFDALQTFFTAATNNPNVSLNKSATLKWTWAFGTAWADAEAGENYTNDDKCDTILGDMIAAQLGATGYTVVVNASGSYKAVSYASVDVASGSANQAVVAYTGDEPSDAAANNVLANLTAAFNARIIIEQVD